MKYYHATIKPFMSPIFKTITIMAKSKKAIKKELENIYYIDFLFQVEFKDVNKIDLTIR